MNLPVQTLRMYFTEWKIPFDRREKKKILHYRLYENQFLINHLLIGPAEDQMQRSLLENEYSIRERQQAREKERTEYQRHAKIHKLLRQTLKECGSVYIPFFVPGFIHLTKEMNPHSKARFYGYNTDDLDQEVQLLSLGRYWQIRYSYYYKCSIYPRCEWREEEMLNETLQEACDGTFWLHQLLIFPSVLTALIGTYLVK